MASVLKYRMDFRDIYERDVQVRIYEQDYEGDVIDLTPGADPLNISYKGEDDDIFQTCITSELKLNCVVEKGSGIVDDIITMQDRQYLIIIEFKNSLEAIEYRWFGFLIPDNIQTDFSYTAGELTISAVDPLSAMKGVQLLDTNGNYYVGLHYLWQFVGGGFLVVMDAWGDIVLPWFDTRIISSLSLSPDETVDVNILEALGCYAETLNKENGRPVTCFEATEIGCKALFMRTYFDNGVWVFEDIYDKAASIFSNDLPVTYKEHELTNLDTNALLLGNTEVVTRNISYKETKCSFEYEDVNGLLINGLMNDWGEEGGGYVLNEWQPNSTLSSAPDYYDRRTGTGRVENPYGMLLINNDEQIASRSEFDLYSNDSISLNFDLKLLNPSFYEAGGETYVYINHKINFAVIVFNNINPEWSWALVREDSENRLVWVPVDLSATTFVIGQWDYSITSVPYWGSITFVDLTIRQDIEARGVKQSIKIDIPSIIPFNNDDFNYTLHVRTDGVESFGYRIDPFSPFVDSSPAVFYNCLAVKEVDADTEGEVTYITRFGNKTISTLEREIQLQTTDNTSISGSILAMEEYTIGGETFQPGFIQKLYRYGQPWQYNCCLTDINAISMMWLTSANQFKVDMDFRCRNPHFNRRLNMERLYDPTKPFTSMYQNRFMMTRMDWNVKAGTQNVTAVSLKVEAKPFDIEYYDEIRDLLELYKY